MVVRVSQLTETHNPETHSPSVAIPFRSSFRSSAVSSRRVLSPARPHPPRKLICWRVLSRDVEGCQNTPSPPGWGGPGCISGHYPNPLSVSRAVGCYLEPLSAVRSPIQPTPAPVLPTILHPSPGDRALAHRCTGFRAYRSVPPGQWIFVESRFTGHRFACVRSGIRSFTGRLSPGLSTRVTKPTRNLCGPNR